MSRLMNYDNTRIDHRRRDHSPRKHQYAFVRRQEFATAREDKEQRRTVLDPEITSSRKRYTDGLQFYEDEILLDEDDEEDSADDDPLYAFPIGRDRRRLTSFVDLGIETFGTTITKQQQHGNIINVAPSPLGMTKRLRVLESTSKSDVPGESPVKLVHDPAAGSSTSHLYRWVHYHEKRLCLSRFRSLAYGSPGLTPENAKTVEAVLERTQKELEKDYVHGKYMAAGVVKCNGHSDRSNPPITSATFVSMPHFKMAEQDGNTRTSRTDVQDHPIRTLLQSAYKTQSTADRNHDQFLSAENGSKSAQTLHVPNLWLLLVNEDYIITYGYVDFDAISSTTIECVEHRNLTSPVAKGEGYTTTHDEPTTDSSRASEVTPPNTDDISHVAQLEAYGDGDDTRLPFAVRPFFAYKSSDEAQEEFRNLDHGPGTTKDEALHHILDKMAVSIAEGFLILNAAKDLPLIEAVENGKELFEKRLELERLDYQALWVGVKRTHKAREALLRAYPTYQRFLNKDTRVKRRPDQGVSEQTSRSEESEVRSTEGDQVNNEGGDSQTEDVGLDYPQSEDDSHDFEKADYYASHLKQHITEQVEVCINAVDEICKAFVPAQFQHSVLLKMWGCMSVLAMLCNESKKPRGGVTSKRPDSGWSVRTDRVLGMNEEMFAFVPKPRKTWSSCRACTSGRIYPSMEDVRKHLHSMHFRDLTKTLEPALAFWIVSTEEAMEHRRLHQYVFLLEIVNDCLEKMLLRVRLASRTLSARLIDGQSIKGEHLPFSLVKAFEEFVVFLLITSLAFSSAKLKSARWTELSHAFGDIAEVKAHARTIGLNGVRAGNAFNNATNQVVLLMMDPKLSDRTDTSVTIGTRQLAHVIVANMLKAPLWNGKGLVETYRNFVSSQHYQVYNKTPQRRRLEDIQALQEEISMVLATYDEQQGALEDFLAVVEPQSSKKASRVRFRRVKRLNDQLVGQVSQDEENLRQLTDILQELEVKARYRIEVLEEDNSKTIFVFTVVTAVFLPLSFVTSFLGMNTKDMRDLESTQTLFWEIGIPVTAIVLLLVVIWAHNSDRLADLWLWLLPGKNRRRREHLRASTPSVKKVKPEQPSILSKMWAKELSRAKHTSLDVMEKV